MGSSRRNEAITELRSCDYLEADGFEATPRGPLELALKRRQRQQGHYGPTESVRLSLRHGRYPVSGYRPGAGHRSTSFAEHARPALTTLPAHVLVAFSATAWKLLNAAIWASRSSASATFAAASSRKRACRATMSSRIWLPIESQVWTSLEGS